MGYDCYNYLPKGTKRWEVEEFMTILGYKKLTRDEIDIKEKVTPFSFYKDEDYKYFEGVYAEVYLDDSGRLVVHIRTTIWRSKYDSDFHNFTIKQLKKRFGGEFESDYGKGRYLKYDGVVREKAESGCYLAFSKFEDNLKRAKMFIDFRPFSKKDFEPKEIELININDPVIVSNNMVVPFLVAIIEDYFRSTYVALLKFSPKRSSIFKNVRLAGDVINLVGSGELPIVEAVAKWM